MLYHSLNDDCYYTADGRAALILDVTDLKEKTSSCVTVENFEVHFYDGNKKITILEPVLANTESSVSTESVGTVQQASIPEEGTLCNKVSNKPQRPCKFCPDLKLQSNLKRHMLRKHPDKINLASMSPLKQRNEIKKLRLDGVFLLNKKNKYLYGNKVNLQRARRSRLDQNDLKMCSSCHIFVSKKTFYKHKCVQQTPSKRPTAVDAHPVLNPVTHSPEFLACINKISSDDIGSLIKETPLLLYLGERLYAKTNDSKPLQKQRRVNGYLRRMGRVFYHFKQKSNPEMGFLDLFAPRNINIMKEAVMECISEGLTQAPMYADSIKYSCDRLKSKFFQEENMDMSTQMERYRRSFSDMYSENFKVLSEDLLRQKYKKSRDPKALIDENDIRKIVNHCELNLSVEFTASAYAENFIEIRKHLCTLLTLENSRRGLFI